MSDALMWVPRGRSRKTKLRVLPLLPLLHSFSLTHTHTLRTIQTCHILSECMPSETEIAIPQALIHLEKRRETKK